MDQELFVHSESEMRAFRGDQSHWVRSLYFPRDKQRASSFCWRRNARMNFKSWFLDSGLRAKGDWTAPCPDRRQKPVSEDQTVRKSIFVTKVESFESEQILEDLEMTAISYFRLHVEQCYCFPAKVTICRSLNERPNAPRPQSRRIHRYRGIRRIRHKANN
jgi:hypothetical protein